MSLRVPFSLSLLAPLTLLWGAQTAPRDTFNAQLAQLVETVNHAVVNVTANIYIDPNGSVKWTNMGYGLIIGSDLILTPLQIVGGCDEVFISRDDQAGIATEIIAVDNEFQFAALDIPKEMGNAVQIAPIADTLRAPAIGDPLFILANTIGAKPVMTLASLDALRPDGLLQISNTLSPAAAGGAVFNARGELLAMIVMQISDFHSDFMGATTNGMILAMPIQQILHRLSRQLNRNGGYLGIVVVDWPSQLGGAHIKQLQIDSPAAKAGLQVGDIVLSSNNHKVANAFDLFQNMQKCRPHDTVSLRILRGDQIHSIDVVLDSLPRVSPPPTAPFAKSSPTGIQQAAEREKMLLRIQSLQNEIDHLWKQLNE